MSKTPSTAFKTFLCAPRFLSFALVMITLLAAAGNALAAPPNVNSNGNATGTVGVPFSYTMTANQAITTWGAAPLPAGLTVDTTTGVISGIPTAVGNTSVVLTGTNANGTGTKTVTFTIAAPPAPTVTSAGTASGTVGTAFSYQITANQAIPSGGWGTTVSIPGVSFMTTTGSFSGTPTTAGTFSGNITATNANGTGSKTLTVTISPQPHTAAPTASFTMLPTAVWEGDTVTLDGSASHTNPDDGSPLIYTWQQQAPTVATLVIALSPNPPKEVIETFKAPAPQPLGVLSWPVTYNLKVTDNLVSGGNKNTTSGNQTTTVYAAPVADAEPKDAHVNEGTMVMLDGSGSTPQGGGATLAYTWTAPAGTTLSDIHAQNPTFTAPLVSPAGTTLTFTLVVTETRVGLATTKDSAPDSVTINVDNVNQPPSAYASSDPNSIVSMATVDENTDPVTLYGSGSDPDNDQLTFHWTQVHDAMGHPIENDDPHVTLAGDSSATPTFKAPNLTTEDHVNLVFQLIVNDGQLDSGGSYVTIRVNNTNNPPTAVPTVSPVSALEGDLVTLDGFGSTDPDGDTLTYTWVQVGTPAVNLVPEVGDPSKADFVAPPVSNAQGSITLTFNLTVDDGNGGTDTKNVSITISHKNLPPIAIATGPGMVPEGNNACLDGSTSWDPEGDALTYAWVQVPTTVDEPIVGLDNANSSGPCFDTPDVGPAGADLHFKLTVADGHNPPSNATVLVHVTNMNQPPTANAGDDQTINEGTTVSLAGSGTDPDGNALTYAWSSSDPLITITPDPSDSSKATFTAPQVFCAGDAVVMTLTVEDGYGGVTTDDVEIDVANVNNAPKANAGGNQDVPEFDPLNPIAVELHGTGDDLDTEEVPTLHFAWTQISGLPVVTLIGSGKDVTFNAPSIPGGDPNAYIELGFRLTVMDDCGGSTTADKTVRVVNIPHAPTAVAQGPATADEGGSTVMLDGSGSTDPDIPPDPLTYVWTQTAGPPVTLVYSPGDMLTHKMPMFITPWVSADTDVKFKLTVSDFPGSTSTAYVTVKILNWNQPPDVSGAHADIPVLWPPDHKMALVHIIGLVNPNNDPITINTVTQDEPTNGLGDGDTPIDAIINGDGVLLRAERSGNGNGRVYHVCFTVVDPEQNATGCVNVMVPKSKKTDIAIDSSPPSYDSTH